MGRDGAYAFADFAADARALADTLAERARRAAGRWSAPRSAAWRRCWRKASRAQRGEPQQFSALVLVDITPRVDCRGRRQDPGLHARARARGLRLDRRGRRRGRRLSAAPAAAALARGPEEEPAAASRRPLALALGPALPRRRPPDRRRIRASVEHALVEAAKSVTIPALLVRGASSELVQEEHAREFLELVPHAAYVDVGRRPPHGGGRPQRPVRRRDLRFPVEPQGLHQVIDFACTDD